jgi:transposase InsO family protein
VPFRVSFCFRITPPSTKFRTLPEAVEYATLEWVDWFNNRRLLEPIGNIPPAEAERRCYANREAMPIAA